MMDKDNADALWESHLRASRGIEPNFWLPEPTWWQRYAVTIGGWTVAVSIILFLAFLWWISTLVTAHAHVPGHPEWDDVLGASTNQQGTSCCGLGDAHLLDFDEWRETSHGYEVFVEGTWHAVQPWKVTSNQVNPSGKAIVWYSMYDGNEGMMHTRGLAIYCFKPLATY